MRRYEESWTYLITVLTIYAVILIGWVMNVVIIWNTMDNPLTAKFILRCIGVFVPFIGGILGYLS